MSDLWNFDPDTTQWTWQQGRDANGELGENEELKEEIQSLLLTNSWLGLSLSLQQIILMSTAIRQLIQLQVLELVLLLGWNLEI
jgi:hypothetical protein